MRKERKEAKIILSGNYPIGTLIRKMIDAVRYKVLEHCKNSIYFQINMYHFNKSNVNMNTYFTLWIVAKLKSAHWKCLNNELKDCLSMSHWTLCRLQPSEMHAANYQTLFRNVIIYKYIYYKPKMMSFFTCPPTGD